MNKEDIKFIVSLLPEWVKHVPSEDHAYDPMYFGTLSRDGDIIVHKRVCKLLKQPIDISTIKWIKSTQ